MNTNEILSIFMEENSECIQAVSKIFRFGLDSSWKGETNREHLEEEIGDLLCMVELLVKVGIIDQNQVEIAKQNKYQKLKKWSTIFDGEE
jgi:NTP pyrophosphatase (non-canonical NTP hydrolase)